GHHHLRQTVIHIIQRDRNAAVSITRMVAVDFLQLYSWTILDPHLDSFGDRRNQTLHLVYENFIDVFVVGDKVIKPASGSRQRAQQIVVEVVSDANRGEIDPLSVEL